RDETWSFMETLGALGGETWFKLGDRDLALHVERTRRLRNGETLSAVTTDIARRFGARGQIVPMSDDPVRTQVMTADGMLDFQRYFVGMQCAPAVTGFRFAGAGEANPHPAFLAALRDPRLRAVVICPSNPFISVDPILALPGVRAALAACPAPVVAISPIIGGEAVKGPTAKMMGELGIAVTAASAADHYAGLIDGFIVDHADAAIAPAHAVTLDARPVLMRSLDDKIALAQATLAFADRLAQQPSIRRKNSAMGAA
ncbi:MAG: 2-phospho-L-lactate transferase CofD family protein, partial [Pseudolabrys sp.]